MERLKKYIVDSDDGSAEIAAISPHSAARQYVSSGSWGEIYETLLFFLDVSPLRRGKKVMTETSIHRITLDPICPKCSADEHKWDYVSHHGDGCGIIYHERCAHCGIVRIERSHKEDPCRPGNYYRSVRYEK